MSVISARNLGNPGSIRGRIGVNRGKKSRGLMSGIIFRTFHQAKYRGDGYDDARIQAAKEKRERRNSIRAEYAYYTALGRNGFINKEQ